MFNASNSFQMFQLSKMCLTFLFNQCNEENVLEILTFFIDYFKLFYSKDINENSAKDTLMKDEFFNHYMNDLILKCYSIIDLFAHKILVSDEFYNLNWDVVEKIASRDTLSVPNEQLVFNAVKEWARQQCKKDCKELNIANIRQVLGSLIYTPRYLTMAVDEFTQGPYSCELLNDEEKQLFINYLKNNSKTNTEIPAHMMMFKMNEPRKYVNIFEIAYEDVEELLDEDLSSNQSINSTISIESNSNAKLDKKQPKKKKTKTKKISNGIRDVFIFIIRMLD